MSFLFQTTKPQEPIAPENDTEKMYFTVVLIVALCVLVAYVIIWIVVPSLIRNVEFFTKFVICYALAQISMYYLNPLNWKNMAFFYHLHTLVPSLIEKIANYTH